MGSGPSKEEKSPSKEVAHTKTNPKESSPAKKSSPAKETPAKKSPPAKETPAKKSSPAKETPAKKSSPAKETPAKKSSPAKEIPTKEVKVETPAKKETPSKPITTSPPATASSSHKTTSSGDSVPSVEVSSTIVTPTKAPTTIIVEPTTPAQYDVTEAELASIEAVSKTLRDTTGGKSLEIVLSPAVKKPKSRVSPPTSPTSCQETLAKKLQDAEDRKQALEQEKLQKLSAKLEKMTIVQEKKEKIIAEKSEQVKEKLEIKLSIAEENKKKHIEEVKDKVSEHTAKIEKAQQALEAAIEAAKEATKTGITEKMSKTEENKNVQLEEMMNALKEHGERVKNVRSNLDEKMKPKAQQILDNMVKKEEAARELKAKQEAERKLKVEEQKKHGDLVRMNKEKLAAEPSLTTESA